MEIACWIAMYVVGCVLSFARFTGAFWGLEELSMEYNDKYVPIAWWNSPDLRWRGLLIVSVSWVGFGGGCFLFSQAGEHDKYFFKWSYKELYMRAANEDFKRLMTLLKKKQ